MQCGNDNQLPKIFLLIGLCLTSVFSVGCQSQSSDAASVIQPCQELVEKEDFLAVGKCYNEQITANPQLAKDIEGTFPKTLFKKCLELKEKKNYEKAIVCLEGVSVLASDSANVQLHLADSYYLFSKNFKHQKLELLGRAEEAIKKSLEINPNKSISYETYGEILEGKEELRSALDAYEKALKLEPKNFRLWMNVALVQEKIGDLSSAISNYNQALTLEPINTLALYNLAKLYEKTGNIDQAIINFEKLLEIKKPYDDAEERLETLKKQGKQSKSKNKSTLVGSSGISPKP